MKPTKTKSKKKKKTRQQLVTNSQTQAPFSPIAQDLLTSSVKVTQATSVSQKSGSKTRDTNSQIERTREKSYELVSFADNENPPNKKNATEPNYKYLHELKDIVIVKPSKNEKAKDIAQTPLRVIVADMIIDLPPSALENIVSGVKNFLNGVCMHELEQFEGLVLSYNNIEFCDHSGIIFEDSPYAHFFIRAEFLVYNASVGYKLCKRYRHSIKFNNIHLLTDPFISVGKVANQSLSHIHLCLYDQFYVKVPRHLIPLDVFLWKDNDEFYDAMFLDQQLNLDRMYAEGQWVFSDTGAIIREDSWLEFEVMGTDTNNGQLYLIGSLLHYSKNNYDQEEASLKVKEKEKATTEEDNQNILTDKSQGYLI
ncbi:15256_t:CDS:2 [Funneliformis mosseae]|uniref:15256_t:CDS:1 n=1 Tax=Funneliformis mosseae TaxID=27381 RepID=A0A9N9HCD6_FUNMO|nr:15256_t:CDS:2 [Funneliformis mosseae]